MLLKLLLMGLIAGLSISTAILVLTIFLGIVAIDFYEKIQESKWTKAILQFI